MFKALMRVQLASVMASLMRSSKGNEKRSGGSAALIAVLFVFVAAILVFAFGAMFYAIAEPMHTMALDWFYFAMAALTAFALCFIGSVFTAQQQLFSARDNELLLAMPIKPKFVLGSRMVMLLAINYALELLVINGKTERLDQMQNGSGHRTRARNVAGILRDLRLDQYNMKHKTPLYSYYFPYFM